MKSDTPLSAESIPHGELSVAFEDALQQTFRHYARRFLAMGAVIVLLLAVIGYLYQQKVGTPVEQLEQDVATQVVTQPEEKQGWFEAAADTAEGGAVYRGEGVLCPAGTDRVIYIDEQALCCQGKLCSNAN